jgi:hypothetical protein
MSRPDESITYLKDRGYCVVRMPRSDLKPLNTLWRAGKKDLTRLGDLSTILIKGANDLPLLSTDNVAPHQISGQESSRVKMEIGINLLGNIIQALGGSHLNLSLGFDKASSMTFKFENVLEDHIDLDRLDQYLSTSSVKPDQHAVTKALMDDEVYVITSILKTAAFTIQAKGDGNSSVGLEAPILLRAASGNLKVDTGKAAEGIVVYEGKTPVVFGFQAVQLIYDEKSQSYSTVDPLDPGKMAAKAIGEIRPNYLELDQGVFFRINDGSMSAGAA